MTTEDLVTLLKDRLPEPESPAKRIRILGAIETALGRLNRMGDYEFGRQEITVPIETGLATYKLRDLYPGMTIKRVESVGYYSDFTAKVTFKDYHEFQAQRVSSAGKPSIGCLHSRDASLVLSPVPDAAYTLYIMAYCLVTQVDDLPIDVAAIVKDFALLDLLPANDPYYVSIVNGLGRVDKDLANMAGYLTWHGSEIKGNPWGLGGRGGDGGRTKTDSQNLLGG